MTRAAIALLLTGLAIVPAFFVRAQTGDPNALADYLDPKIPSAGPVERLKEKLDKGELKLTYESGQGYLRSVLRALGISSATQTLVFSKTSLQSHAISPRTPRALYFSDECYVGWVNGGDVLEFASADPVYGMRFYTLQNAPAARPKMARQTYDCIQCHSGPLTEDVPGVMVRSVYPWRDGRPALQNGSYKTTDASPLKERWGGWYVTGTHGKEQHLGNAFVKGDENFSTLDPKDGANITDLRTFFDTSAYLTPHSDLVALLVAEHQMGVQNRLTRASYGTRSALRDMKIVHPELKDGEYSESCLSRVKSVCESLVQVLFFADEAPLGTPVAGTTRFAAQYEKSGPLRQLDLKTRLYALRCSPMVFSPAMESLPQVGRDYLTRRFTEILAGRDPKLPLPEAERTAIREILTKTRPWLVTPPAAPGS